jgi:hypothetical protein
MDMAAVSGLVTGLKAIKDLLQVALRTTVAVEAAAQIGTALDRLGEVQDKLYDLRDELFQLQHANEDWLYRVSCG